VRSSTPSSPSFRPLPSLLSLPSFLAFLSLFPPLFPVMNKGSGLWRALKLSPSESGRSPAAKRHLVHLGLKRGASCESKVSAVHQIIASAHKTQAFRRSKLLNGGRFLWVLSTLIIFSMDARSLKALSRRLCY